jgi:hypothetical protein
VNPFTQTQVDSALKALGAYRVRVAQEIALEGPADALSGALLLALGLRETGLRNVNNLARTDHGCFQISELYHGSWLASQPGCREGEWVAQAGRTAIEDNYCPRYTPGCQYALQILKDNYTYAVVKGVDADQRLAFSVAAYNAGVGGAMKGYREARIDAYTSLGDYSAWVLNARSQINRFLADHPSWRPA